MVYISINIYISISFQLSFQHLNRAKFNGKFLWLGFFNPSPDRWFAKWKWKWMFLIKCYSDKAHFSEFWSVAPFPLTWKHHFEGKGARLLGLPGAPNTLKMGVLGAPGLLGLPGAPEPWTGKRPDTVDRSQTSDKIFGRLFGFRWNHCSDSIISYDGNGNQLCRFWAAATFYSK